MDVKENEVKQDQMSDNLVMNELLILNRELREIRRLIVELDRSQYIPHQDPCPQPTIPYDPWSTYTMVTTTHR